MNLTNLTIWTPSKNRACQLSALIESIYSNWEFLPAMLIHYEYSNDNFKAGYDKLIQRWPEITWIHGSNLYKDFLSALQVDTTYFCGVTDDCLFYRPCTLCNNDLDFIFDSAKNVLTLSFRLGRNTVVQDYRCGSRQDAVNAEEFNQFIRWNFKKHDDCSNAGYPFSVDGHCYITKRLEEYTKDFARDCTQLRSWEGTCNNARYRGRIREDYMASLQNSIVFCNPVNCVQDPPLEFSNRVHISADHLNNLFLEGYEIDIEKVKGLPIIGAHQEHKYEFARRSE